MMRISPVMSLKTLFGRVAVATALSFAAGLASAAPQDKVTEEVIVEGTRPELEQRANTFVTGVTHRGYAVESLVRWNKPICPLVAGIPANQGEFMLHRDLAGRARRRSKPRWREMQTQLPRRPDARA